MLTPNGKWPLALLFLLALLGSGAAVAPVQAALDPEIDRPYQLKVVLHIADHRLLTKIFKDQVRRELQDSLQAALGKLAVVEVVTTHPKLKEIEERGLQQVLDAWKDVSDTKTHFVLIDYADGQYEIQLRQHDGLTGQASAVVRQERIDDRQFVARRIGQLIGEDFGPVATITDKGDGKMVKVTLKGSSLGAPLGPWVKPGEVFALVQISAAGGGLRAYRVPWALLQVKEEANAGVCTCRLFHRHRGPLDGGAGVLGYRCLKLSTRTAQPLRLQLVNATAKRPTPEANRQIYVQQYGFDEDRATRVGGQTNGNGFLATDVVDKEKGFFNHVAFVLVLSGDEVKANIPVPLVDDRPVVIPVTLGSEAATQVADRKNFWTHQVYESVLVVADLFKELKDLVGKADKRKSALDKVQAALKAVKEDRERFEEMRKRLQAEAKEVLGAGADRLDWSEGKRGLDELKTGQELLQQYVVKLEKLVQQGDSAEHKDLEAKQTQAQLAEEDADYDKALALYDEVIKAEVAKTGAADKDLQKHYDTLKAAWNVRDEEHRQARDYICKTWPNVDPVRMLPELPVLEKSFEKCKSVGDSLTPRKILKVALNHVTKLQEVAKGLNEGSDDDRNTARTIDEIKQQLTRLLTKVSQYVEKSAK